MELDGEWEHKKGDINYDPEFFMSYYVGLRFGAVVETRQIYTLWEFLGDVGGLVDMLTLLGSPIFSFIQLILGSSLNRLLIKSIFKT